MARIRVIEDLSECAHVWEKAWPKRCFFDLWPVRCAFAVSFDRQPFFIVAEEGDKITGLLALSWIPEAGYFGQFPGEIWQNRTWLEQNKIPARTPEIFQELLAAVPGPAYLRYLDRSAVPLEKYPFAVDEVGYLFLPGEYDFSFDTYMQSFSGKSRKKLHREMAELERLGPSVRHDHFPDTEILFRMNLEAFGPYSYFTDPRFQKAFEALIAWLNQQGMLRTTTLLLGGRIAAVDIGAVWNNSYTVLAGATHADFPGVAKMINFHHLQWACSRRLDVVDFLCGDFGWKKRFHLTERPLYEMHLQAELRQAEASLDHAREQ